MWHKYKWFPIKTIMCIHQPLVVVPIFSHCKTEASFLKKTHRKIIFPVLLKWIHVQLNYHSCLGNFPKQIYLEVSSMGLTLRKGSFGLQPLKHNCEGCCNSGSWPLVQQQLPWLAPCGHSMEEGTTLVPLQTTNYMASLLKS